MEIPRMYTSRSRNVTTVAFMVFSFYREPRIGAATVGNSTNSTRERYHACPSLIVLDSDGSYRRRINRYNICHGKVTYIHLCTEHFVIIPYTWPYANELIKIQLFHALLPPITYIIPSSCFFFFFFFPSYLFIPRECCKRKKEKKKYHLILPHSFPHKKCYAHCAILRVAKTTFSRVISFFPFFFPLPPVFVQDRINVELMQILQLRDTIAWRASSSSSWFFWF